MRILTILILLLTLPLAVASALLYLAYGARPAGACEGALDGLSAPVAISLEEPNVYRLDAASETDAYRSLGAIQACRNAWTMILLRQTAAGRLSEWFGPVTLPLDRFTHMLGLASTAKAAYKQLGPSDREVLNAYAAGIRSALAIPAIRSGDQFSLLDITPDPWEPWHSLLLERLFGWLSGPPIELPIGIRSPEGEVFVAGDRLLRSWLHIDHAGESLIWIHPGRDESSLFTRLVWGDGALSLVDEVVLTWPGRRVWGVASPGWPALRVGRSDSLAWGFLLSGHAELRPFDDSEDLLRTRHERMQYAPDGDEELVVTRESDNRILIGRAATPERPDSLFDLSLVWPARRGTGVWPSFRRLTTGEWNGSLESWGYSGAFMTREGQIRLVGSPAVRSAGAGSLISHSRFAEFLAAAFAETASVDDLATPAGTRSEWASRITPILLGLARRSTDRPEEQVYRTAIGYLDAWDYRFDLSSIGATIFDRWTAALGGPQFRRWETDSTGVETARALRHVVDELAAEFGNDHSRWRWEDAQPSQLNYAVWSSSLLTDAGVSLPAKRLYEPLRVPRAGHPSSPVYGPSADRQTGPAPAVWSGWISTGQWDMIFVTARPPRAAGFLGRFKNMTSETVETLDLTPGVRYRTLTLTPPD